MGSWYTEQQDETLIRLKGEGKTIAQMAAITGRSMRSVQNRIGRIARNVPMTIRTDWEPWEDEAITAGREAGETHPEIQAKRLPERSIDGIKNRVRALLRTGKLDRLDPFRPVPADFAENVKTMVMGKLRTHYSAKHTTIERWAAEAGVTIKYHWHRDPPEDFAKRAPNMTLSECQREWHCALDTVRRWYRVLGLTPAKYSATANFIKASPDRPEHLKRRPHKGHVAGQRAMIPNIPSSLADRAARHLQIAGFIPVCRMTVYDPQADKNMWRVGRLDMTSGDLIDLAESKGFNSREWAEVVAA